MPLSVTDRTVAGPHGDLRLRLYRPADGVTPVAGIVWAHGGAFYRGDLDMHEAEGVARALAARGVVVVSVDYALVPPFEGAGRAPAQPARAVRFPVPSHEMAFAYAWATSADLGVDPHCWSIGGASAGGNLAAGASLRLRDAAAGVPDVAPAPSGTTAPVPRSVVLAYPVAHHELPAASDELLAKVRTISPDESFPPPRTRAMNDNYLGHDRGPDSPYAFPGGQDLRGLPPTMVVTSDRDVLRATGEAYAAELAAAGTDVLLVREDGTRHGHLNQPQDPGCGRSIARIAAWLTTAALVGTAHEPPA
ncbi:alpha/beta hydrolase [Isoptericola jiangsuensis]|uniref:alpha/beta hydrolase n=1 Tax=Isoptericola jiangsuensis TaxID=548579 RepID=UPI003AB0F948